MLFGEFLYVIEAKGHDVIKVGRSGCVESRLASLQSSHFAELSYFGLSVKPFSEKPLHARLSPFHVRGEWFRFDSHGREALTVACSELQIRLVPYDEFIEERAAFVSSCDVVAVPGHAKEKAKAGACLIDQCQSKVRTRGLCKTHYHAFRSMARGIRDYHERMKFETQQIASGRVLPSHVIRELTQQNPFAIES